MENAKLQRIIGKLIEFLANSTFLFFPKTNKELAMKVYRFVGYFVIFLFFIFVSLPAARAVSFTFSGTINDYPPMEFTVLSVGVNKPPVHTSSGSTLWSWDWQINSISKWALLPYPVTDPNIYVNNGPSVGQLLYGAPYPVGTGWGFEYSEDLGGNNTSARWEQLITIKAEKPFDTIADLLEVSMGFRYHEATRYTHYTSDGGGTTANPPIDRVNGYLTLVAFDLSDIGPVPGPAPVPEPSTLLLLGSGLLGLWGFRKEFRN